MDIVVATSRGRSLARYFKYRWSAILIWRKGATIEQLAKEADKTLRKHRGNHKPHHVFFVAGLPDLTTMVRNGKYEETVLIGEANQIVTRLTEAITSAHNFITSNHNAKTAFATITPCSLKTWNLHRLHIKKTHILKEEPHYEEMQQKMIQATVRINKFIIKHNESNSMPTPRLAKKIIKKAGKQKKTPPVYYAKLIDGVHPNENTSEDWIDQISMAMLESRRPELFRNGHYIGNDSQNISEHKHPQPVESPCPTLPTIIDTDSDDDEQLMRRPWRTY